MLKDCGKCNGVKIFHSGAPLLAYQRRLSLLSMTLAMPFQNISLFVVLAVFDFSSKGLQGESAEFILPNSKDDQLFRLAKGPEHRLLMPGLLFPKARYARRPASFVGGGPLLASDYLVQSRSQILIKGAMLLG